MENDTPEQAEVGGGRQPLAERIRAIIADGSDVRRLTTSEDNETGASWSPDGLQIAYQRKLSNKQPQQGEENEDENHVDHRGDYR